MTYRGGCNLGLVKNSCGKKQKRHVQQDGGLRLQACKGLGMTSKQAMRKPLFLHPVRVEDVEDELHLARGQWEVRQRKGGGGMLASLAAEALLAHGRSGQSR